MKSHKTIISIHKPKGYIRDASAFVVFYMKEFKDFSYSERHELEWVWNNKNTLQLLRLERGTTVSAYVCYAMLDISNKTTKLFDNRRSANFLITAQGNIESYYRRGGI